MVKFQKQHYPGSAAMSHRDFQKDQIEHLQLVQKQVLDFSQKIQQSAIEHDTSKWSDLEYEAFVDSRESLRGSKDGKDLQYQKHLKSDAIQFHIQNNAHHAENWDAKGEAMPIHEVISMFFDWRSRCLAKGGSMDDFWEFNLAKLKNQPHAIPIVEQLKKEYPVFTDEEKEFLKSRRDILNRKC